MRRASDQALCSHGPAMGAGHAGPDPVGLHRSSTVDEHQLGRSNRLLVALPADALARYVRPLLLAGVQAFFEGEALGSHKGPDRAVVHPDAALG